MRKFFKFLLKNKKMLIPVFLGAAILLIYVQPSLFRFTNELEIERRFLEELPVVVYVEYLTLSYRPSFSSDKEEDIRAVYGALEKMRVIPMRAGWHTDDYLVYRLEWKDGSRVSYTFQGGKLLHDDGSAYPVIGLNGLMKALPPPK